MFEYTGIDPVALQLGPLAIRWYGLMYLVGFAGGWWLARVRARRPDTPVNVTQVEDLFFYVALGVILGGRIGYVIFYDNPLGLVWPWEPISSQPASGFFGWIRSIPVPPVVRVWAGGMSFHGGFLGVMLAIWLQARRIGCRYWALVDFCAPLVPIGLGAGRIGNFINGELWGRPTDLPWGFKVSCSDPRAADLCFQQLNLPDGTAFTPPLHPSPLYEALLEGVVLFTILWIFSSKPRPVMAVSGLFALLYGIFRIFVEFYRMPDAHIGYLAFGWLTMGQVLTLPLLAVGILLLSLAYLRGDAQTARAKRDKA